MTVATPPVLQRLAPVSGPLVGREAELDRLREAWARASTGRGGTVLLVGEAGVGKTRLVAELAYEVEEAGGTVAVGACRPGDEPYQPLVDALGPLPPGTDRDAVFDAVADVVAVRARRAPMLLVVDDLHHSDRSTLLVLGRLVQAAAGSSVLVLAVHRETAVDRSHPLGEFLARLPSGPEVERLNLGGLAPEAVVEMVGDAELAGRVWRQSEGNPVRVKELLRLESLDGAWPPDFDELVACRVVQLRPTARKLLEAAAVAGPEFHPSVAASAAGVPAERAPGVLKQLAAAGLVVEEQAGQGDTRRFTSEMLREAVVRRLAPTERVALHLRTGRALERQQRAGGPRPSLLALHFRAAAPVGGSAAAVVSSVRAGDRAMEVLAWEDAADHYGHGVAASAGAGPRARADLLLSLGEAQRLAGETARARQAFLEAATLARSCADGARMARAALALGQVAAVWGADPELEALAGEAGVLLGRGSAPGSPAASARSAFTDFASDALYDVLDGVEPRRRRAPPAPATPDVPSDPAASAGAAPAAALLRARHVALAGLEHAGERLAAADELVALAGRTGDDDLAITGRGWRLVDALGLGRVDQAAADQVAHADLARRLADPRHDADAAAWSAMRAMLDGRVDDARPAASDAFALAVEAGDPEAEASYLLQRWWLALEWGTPEELSEVAGACRARAATAAAGRAWRAAAALALARSGRLDLAAEELRRVVDLGLGELIRDPDRLQPLTCLVEVAWMLGDGYRAAAAGPLLEPFSDRLVVAGRGMACLGSAARASGLVAASAGHWDQAERQFKVALAVHRRIGALALLARTRFQWSQVLVERGRKGDKRRAAESRRKATEIATRLGMSRLLEDLAGH